MKSEIAKAVQEQVFRFESLMTDLQEQKERHILEKQAEDKHQAAERQKELIPRKIKANTDPWKDANTHGYEIESDIKRLKVNMLTNTDIYRINILPRSYDQRVKTELHPKGYKLTSNSIGYFGEVDGTYYTKEGRAQLERNIESFTKHCEEHRADETYRRENKRQIMSNLHEPRWAYSKNNGGELQRLVSDPNNLFLKSLMPLDKKKAQVQDDAFKRTSIHAGVFRAEVSSLI